MARYEAVECFWVESTGKATRSLRRYSHIEGEGTCPDCPGQYSYHNTSVKLGEDFESSFTDDDNGSRYIASIEPDEYTDDDRWPTHCSCGYEFTDEDSKQVVQEPIYESEDGRRSHTSQAHGATPTPGAMFDTFWRAQLRKEDGLAISVVLPDGSIWCIDDEATSGGYWTRTGTPPKLTVTPSILVADYHGFLTDGVLSADIG